MRNFEDKRVGGAAVMDRMLTKGVLTSGSEIPYGRGIVIDEYKGLKTIGHSGGDAGFRSNVMYFPGEKFGVAVFSNLASFDPGAMSRQIADIYLASQLKPQGPGPVGAKQVRESRRRSRSACRRRAWKPFRGRTGSRPLKSCARSSWTRTN